MTSAGSPDGVSRSVFVVAPPGVEPVLAREVEALGLRGEVVPGGVSLSATPAELYELNLHLRTATRVLVRVAEFRARTFYELERHAARVPWHEFTVPGLPVRLRVTSRKSRLYHQRAIEQRLRAAIDAPVASEGLDEEAEGDREQLFIVRFLHDRCVISADSSGALLHRRGYRQALARAPLRENLAAAMLLAAGWDGTAPLLDPLCGSGTIPIEAAWIARRIAPGARRARHDPGSFAFTTWPDFQPRLFERVLTDADALALPEAPVRIVAADRDAGAIDATVANAARAGASSDIEAAVRAVSAVDEREPGGWLVTNPPYGARVGDASRLRDLYAALGQLARRAVPGGHLVMLSADPRLEAAVGLAQREVLSTRNGGIPVRVVMGAVPSDARGTR